MWDDQNGNGKQDADEPLLDGVTVNLLNSRNETLLTAQTVSGVASFYPVPADTDVKLEFVLPDGNHAFTHRHRGHNKAINSDARRSNGRTQTFRSTAGAELIDTVDAGLWTPGTVETTVWDDQNGNGKQDNGEPTLDGVTVRLLDHGNNELLSTTTQNGVATFSAVPADTEVKIEVALPDGHAFTHRDRGHNKAIDSDVRRSNGRSHSFRLTTGNATETRVDAGLWTPGTIEATVWNDQNGNGKQDSDEALVDGVTVKLLDHRNQVVDTTITVNGVAVFSNVAADTQFRLEFVAPEDAEFTHRNAGHNRTIDSDARRSNGRTGTFQLTQGSQTVSNFDAGVVFAD